jgi:hypothetical protein
MTHDATTDDAAYAVPPSLDGSLATVLDVWVRCRRGETQLPFADDLDPAAWPDGSAVALVGVFHNPLRLRLDRAGTQWTRRFGRDVHGHFLDEFAGRDPFDGLEEQCGAAIRSRGPAHAQPSGSRPARLALPYWGDGRVSTLVVVLASG